MVFSSFFFLQSSATSIAPLRAWHDSGAGMIPSVLANSTPASKVCVFRRFRHVQTDLQAGIITEQILCYVAISTARKQRRQVLRNTRLESLHTLGGSIEGGRQGLRQRPVLRQDLLQSAHAGLVDIHPEGCQDARNCWSAMIGFSLHTIVYCVLLPSGI